MEVISANAVAWFCSRALSRSGKKVLHVDKHDYYGSTEAAFSLQEAEEWVNRINQCKIIPPLHMDPDIVADWVAPTNQLLAVILLSLPLYTPPPLCQTPVVSSLSLEHIHSLCRLNSSTLDQNCCPTLCPQESTVSWNSRL